MRRREFIRLLGGAAAGWSVGANAQPPRMLRIGVLTHLSSDDPEGQARFSAFRLQALGWIEGLNIRIDYRWSEGDADRPAQTALFA